MMQTPANTSTEHARDLEIFKQDLLRAERGSPRDKREAGERWRVDMATDPTLVAERMGWLLAGHYGAGAYREAWARITAMKFGYPTDWLLEILAALEWNTPKTHHMRARRALGKAELAILETTVEREIGTHLRNRLLTHAE